MSDSAVERKAARAHRAAVEPLWTEPLFDELRDALPTPKTGSLLIAESRCGYLPLRVGDGLPENLRLIVLESERELLDEARDRVEEVLPQRTFFVPERVDGISYADDVFQSSLCFNGLVTARQVSEGLSELKRVTEDEGHIALAAPMAGSFEVFYDLIDEAFRAFGIEERLGRIDDFKETLVTPGVLAGNAEKSGLREIEIKEVRWSVAFDRGREFLHSRLIRETLFPHWMGMIPSKRRERTLRYVADAVDTYWHNREFQTEIRAGFLCGRC